MWDVRVLVFVFSVAIMAYSVFLSSYYTSSLVSGDFPRCLRFLPALSLTYAIIVFLSAGMGLICAILQSRKWYRMYLTVLLVLFSITLSSIILATLMNITIHFDAIRRDTTDDKQRLQTYPILLRDFLLKGNDWLSFKSCLAERQLCFNPLFSNGTNVLLEIGCCRPPSSCVYERDNKTSWELKNARLSSNNPVCLKWSNDINKRCYDCDACKIGYISAFMRIWWSTSGCLFFYILIFGIFHVLYYDTMCTDDTRPGFRWG